VDTGELRRILETRLGDFSRYLSEIGAFMAREKGVGGISKELNRSGLGVVFTAQNVV
jgi:hypothetical protein